MKILKYFLILFLLFGFFPAPTFSAVTPDALIKSSESTLYYYAADGKRYVFPNEKTYKSWFTDFSRVISLSNAELAAITLAGNVTYRPGVKMIKIQTDPKTYAVSRGGILRWVQTEEVATSLYGSDWNTKIDDVPDTFFINYQIGDPIESADDYDREAEMSSATTINDNKGVEKSASPLVSDTDDVTVEEPAEEPEEPEEPAEESVVAVWENSRIRGEEFRQQNPDIVATDSDFAAVWTYYSAGERDEINFAFIDSNNTLKSVPFEATDNIYESTVPSIARGTLGYGIVWEDYDILRREIYFMRVDTDGNKVTTDKRVTNKIGFARNPKVAWSGTNFGIVWWDSRYFVEDNHTKGSLYFHRADTVDTLVGDNIRITTGASSVFEPDLVWGNNEYAAVWADDRNGSRDIYFVRFNEEGVVVGSDDVRITETEDDSLNPSLVWDGSNYGIVWQEKVENVGSSGKHYEIYYQKINTDGEKVGNAVRLTTKDNGVSEDPEVILNNDKFGIVWTDYRGYLDKSQSDIYFMEINSDGAIITPEENVSDSNSISFEPSIAVLDGDYVVVYTDDIGSHNEIYSAIRQ
ncbi:MAG: hypothetical protein U9P90_01335 [Patescibacteria group bacterium]|nr:hypothetical protein [Patescibacteria group bacterium]